MRAFLLIIGYLLISCVSPKGPKFIGMEDYDDESQASGHAYVTDAINIRTPMKVSDPDWKPIRFYFKDCTEVGERFYYSRTSYDCTYP